MFDLINWFISSPSIVKFGFVIFLFFTMLVYVLIYNFLGRNKMEIFNNKFGKWVNRIEWVTIIFLFCILLVCLLLIAFWRSFPL